MGRTLAFFFVGVLAIGTSAMARAEVIPTTIGNPSFVLTDFHLFSAPIGTADTGYAGLAQTTQAILPPPNHEPNPALGIGPGTPHTGPYDQEIGQGVAANDFAETVAFTTAQYSNGNGVFLAFMLVPSTGSPSGSSPDFASGPILPNVIFPLTINGSTLTDGTVNDVLGQFQVPAINQVQGFEGLGGHSHIPFFFVDNFDFATRPVAGSYEYQISITDTAGNGYQLSVPFQVQAVPEPPTWVLTGLGGIATVGYALRYRRSRPKFCAVSDLVA